MMPFDDVTVKARPLIDTEHADHTANNAADDAANDASDRARCAFAFAGSSFNTAWHALSGGSRGNKQCRRKQRPHNNPFHRISSFVGANDKPTAPDWFPLSASNGVGRCSIGRQRREPRFPSRVAVRVPTEWP